MKNIMKKAIAFMLTLVMAFTIVGIGAEPMQIFAEGIYKYFYASDSVESAYAGVEVTKSIVVDCGGMTYGEIFTPDMCGVVVSIFDNSDNLVDSKAFSSVDGEYSSQLSGYVYSWGTELVGNSAYTVKYTFDTNTSYLIVVYRDMASLNKTEATITKGFSTTLKVDGGKAVSWKSSNTKVATVKNGKVTGKTKGSATITATLEDGTELRCKVSVKNNVYSEKKMTLSNTEYGRHAQVYKASYSGKKLVLKVRIVNNTGINYTKIENLKISVKTSSGKTIGTYSLKSKSAKVPANSVKEYTFTIDNPKMKNADLRLAKTKVESGTLVYYY